MRERKYLGLPEVNISVAERGEEDLQTHFTSLWWGHLYFFDGQRLASLPCHSGYMLRIFNPYISYKSKSRIDRERGERKGVEVRAYIYIPLHFII